MQGDEVTIATVDLGSHTTTTMRTILSWWKMLGFVELRRHYIVGRVHRQVFGHPSEVLLRPFLSLDRADSRPLKVHGGGFPGGSRDLPIGPMPFAPPKSPHSRDRVVGLRF